MGAEAFKPDMFKNMPVIDVDTHYTEPYDLWSKRAPAKYKDLVPQVRQIDGVNHWFINDQRNLQNPNNDVSL